MIKKIILILLLAMFLTPSLYANNDVSFLANNWFTKFSANISYKYSDSKEILYFEGFSTKLNNLLSSKNFTDVQIKLINDLIKLSNERVFKIKITNEEYDAKIILKTNNLLNNFKYFSYNPERIYQKNGIWYTYKFDQHLTFPKGTNLRIEDLTYNGINPNNTLVFLKDDNSLGFVNNYTIIKLITDDIIYGIPNKYNFLKEIKDDKKKNFLETDNQFENLKNITNELTNGKKESEKIKIIYNYVLENIEYPINYSLNDYSIFSGIDTISNKSGVCEGYTKIFLYMLNFAGINDTEVIRGYVIDAQDFPKIGHAWVRIGNNYYDPTFDDPIGQSETKIFRKYKYFDLPYDIFYTNRYDFNSLPDELKTKNIDYIKNHITEKIALIINKYRYYGYNILKLYILKLDYGIELDKKLDTNDLIKIMSYYEVDNFKFTKDGKQKTITNLKYFKITDLNVETIIEQINYDFSGKYLFKWKLEDGTYEYRFGYDVILK